MNETKPPSDETAPREPGIVPESEVPAPSGLDATLPPAPAPRRLRAFLYRRYPHLLSAAAVIALAVVSVLLWREWTKRFPVPLSGAYLGVIHGVFGDGAVTGLYLERQAGSSRAVFAVLKDGWQPRLIEGLSIDEHGPREIAAITVAGPGGSVRFTGKADGEDGFSGNAVEIGGGAAGRWQLSPVHDAAPGDDVRAEVRLAVLLKRELAEVDRRISEAEREVPEQRAEIQKLTEFVTEGEQLRVRADEKQKELVAELARVRQQLAARQGEAQKLSQQFDLSQRSSGMGRLVSLSRESLDRETHWFNSVLRTEPQQPSEDLEQAVERGQKILALKREIAQERERIAALQRRPEASPQAPAESPAAPVPSTQEKSGIRKLLPW